MSLTTAQKQRIFLKLRDKQAEDFSPYLIQAIRQGLVPSVIGDLELLNVLIPAYNACKANPELETLQLSVIEAYIHQTGAREFKEALAQPFDEEHWQRSDFLRFLADCFNINIDVQAVVKLSIYNGKVYWQVIQDEAVLYDNYQAAGSGALLCFDHAATVTMNWVQFRRFKDAGKRGSSVTVTPQRFYHACLQKVPDMQRTIADRIWDELKAKGILDKNNRLSHYWMSHSGSVKLDRVEKKSDINYTQISEALNQITQTPRYARHIAEQCVIYRPARSLKHWYRTGKLENLTPKGSACAVRVLDVSNCGDLTAHAVTDDALDHDHIPSTVQMREYQIQERNAFRIEERDQKDASQWGCIELEHGVHAGGLTYKMNKKDQLKMARPFYEEVEDYLSKLDPKKIDERIATIGAFRYLYRSQVKQKFTVTSTGFFHTQPELRQDIDQLLMRELEKTIALT